MKLQKHGSRVRNGKEYFKWTLVVPPDEIEALGWEEGEDLEPKHQGDKLLIERSPTKSSSPSPKKRGKG